MVRINIISPLALADQHLVAEYNEMLMLLGYVRKYPDKDNIPSQYLLGPGHIRFFKDKLGYIANRHELLKKEMRRRGFKPEKTIMLSEFPKNLHGKWRASEQDKKIIRARIISKLQNKPGYYRYYGKYRPTSFLVKLIENAS